MQIFDNTFFIDVDTTTMSATEATETTEAADAACKVATTKVYLRIVALGIVASGLAYWFLVVKPKRLSEQAEQAEQAAADEAAAVAAAETLDKQAQFQNYQAGVDENATVVPNSCVYT